MALYSKMNILPIEFSIVVVGEDCNPTILNPDFLKYREIVPEAWGWELGGPLITTPALSIVTYATGIMIKVEPKRFQVTDANGAGNVAQSKALDIARRYIEVLPHVRYTAVGNNIRVFTGIQSPQDFLKDRFIRPGSWDTEQQPLRELSLSFGYAHGDSRLTLSLEAGVLVHREGKDEQLRETQGLHINGNYHRECRGYPTDGQVLSSIAKAPDDMAQLQALVSEMLSNDSRAEG